MTPDRFPTRPQFLTISKAAPAGIDAWVPSVGFLLLFLCAAVANCQLSSKSQAGEPQVVHASQTEDSIIRRLVSKQCEVLRNDDGAASHLSVPENANLSPDDVTSIARLRSLSSAAIATDPAGPYLASLSSIPALTTLGITSGKCTDDDAVRIASMENLKTVLVISRRMTEKGAMEVAKLPKLEELSLTYVALSNDATAAIGSCKHLQALSLYGCGITSDNVRNICFASQLSRLGVVGARLKPSDMAELRSLPRLRVLKVVDVGLTGDGVAELNNLSTLDELWLGGSRLTERDILTLRPRSELKALTIDGVALAETTVQELQRRLGDCEITVLNSDDGRR